MNASYANVTLQVSNHSASTLSLGGTSSRGGMWITDAELDFITTKNRLTIGSFQTDQVFVNGISHTDTPVAVAFMSMNRITFEGTASTFMTQVTIDAWNDVTVKSHVTANDGTLDVTADWTCNRTGHLRISSTGALFATNQELLLRHEPGTPPPGVRHDDRWPGGIRDQAHHYPGLPSCINRRRRGRQHSHVRHAHFPVENEADPQQ
mmetsp:Transcript_30456/g.74154  ORF Transcript_30456/g.74154 Transcript_30456/m.74154 type:complete len:207 (+) Transcript_30456:3873-4493(+)